MDCFKNAVFQCPGALFYMSDNGSLKLRDGAKYYLLKLTSKGVHIYAASLGLQSYSDCLSSISDLLKDAGLSGLFMEQIFTDLTDLSRNLNPEETIFFTAKANTARLLSEEGWHTYIFSFEASEKKLYVPENVVILNSYSQAPESSRKMSYNKQEVWDLFDSDRQPLGLTCLRNEKYPDGMYHLVISVWIRNSQGQFLISQRHPDKFYPLFWECTGGCVAAGETPLSTVVREIKEELGLTVKPSEPKLVYQTRREEFKDFYDVWLVNMDVDLHCLTLQKSEVVDAKWASFEEIQALDQQGLFHPLLSYYKELLPKLKSEAPNLI
ncbi:NUDIX hydrolase [Lachnoclostridium edouardi]|uniref:NUDIX hydrolase n=1 Tax=Lachnoclostridium edouardi TaxID=1926283 RepID=UPI001FA885E5|nr:NUDIX domain-containing protein [Lachnoclostridium edouardi]